jgi:hypothetical protein
MVSAVSTPLVCQEALASLVGDVDEFFREHWARRAAVRRPAGTSPARLITAAEVWEEIDCGLLLSPFLRVFGDDAGRDEEAPAGGGGPVSGASGRVDGAGVRRAFGNGATVQLNNVEEWHEPTRALLDKLTPGFPGVLRAVAFLSPPGTTPVITAHVDNAHVFVIQIEGEKDWAVGPLDETTVGDAVFCSSPDIPPEGRLDTTLCPGQVLYVPHGCAHYALARSTPSLHLSVNVEEPSIRHLLNGYLAQFMTSPDYRYLSGTPHSMPFSLAGQLRDSLVKTLSTADPDQVDAAALRLFARKGGGAPGR